MKPPPWKCMMRNGLVSAHSLLFQVMEGILPPSSPMGMDDMDDALDPLAPAAPPGACLLSRARSSAGSWPCKAR